MSRTPIRFGMVVSVPCNCGAEVGPSHTHCPACRTPLSRELREAIEAALEAAHSEYRDARRVVRGSATILLVIGLVYPAFGLLYYLMSGGDGVSPLTQEESRNRVTGLVENLILGCVFLGCHQATKRAPRAGFGVALGIWITVQALVFSLSPATLLLSFTSVVGIALLMAKIIVLVLLIRDTMAAFRSSRILAGVASAERQTEREGDP